MLQFHIVSIYRLCGCSLHSSKSDKDLLGVFEVYVQESIHFALMVTCVCLAMLNVFANRLNLVL